MTSFRSLQNEKSNLTKIGLYAIIQRTMPVTARKIVQFFMRVHLGILSFLRGTASDAGQRMEQGQSYLRDGRIDEAAKEFRTLLEKSPIDEKAALWLTRTLLIEGNYLEAQKVLFRAIAWHSKSIPLRQQLASLLHTTGSYWDAETEYKKLLVEYSSDQMNVCLGLASLKFRNARYDEAFESYRRALEIDPTNIAALLGVIECGYHSQSAKNFIAQSQGKILENNIVAAALKKCFTCFENVKAPSNNLRDSAVLFIDHFLPCSGGSAGSAHHFEVIRLLRESGVHVTTIARNGEYQSQGKSQLEAIGVETFATDPERLVAWNYKSDAQRIDFADLFKKRHYVLAILARHNIAAAYMNVIRDHAPQLPIAILTADLQFEREEKKEQLYGSRTLVASEIRAAELQSYNEADCLIAVSDPDAETLRKMFNSKYICTIPLIYRLISASVEFESRNDLMFVGNFVHPPNADAVVHYSGHILPALRERLPGVRTFIVGANSLPLLESFVSDDLVITGYVPAIEPFLESCKINVAPLRYGSGMNGKVVESMAAGLPVVTTPTVAEAIGTDSGLIVAEDDEEFAEKVAHLYQSEEFWRSARDQASNTVKNKFSPEAVKKQIDELLVWAAYQSGKQRSNL